MKNAESARRNVAVILAGGVGSRMGAGIPKQLLTVCGRTVLEHTIDAFEKNACIDEIIVVANASIIGSVKALQGTWPKVHRIVEGGRERSDSSLAAIRAYEDEDCNLIFHDAVRMLVSQDIINRVCTALLTHEAVDVAIPSTDTILCVRDNRIESIPDRSLLFRSQTPQAFRRRLIAQAYELAEADPDFRATDDCGVVLKYVPDARIFVVDGEERNIKITYPEDIPYVEHLLLTACPIPKTSQP